MRIISGEKKGFRLYSLPGEKTRPTRDFVKEAIFSIIFDCEGMRVLDLYSGSGSLGFEALSRGASSLDLVDWSERAVRVMQKNIDKLEFNDLAKTHRARVDGFLKTSEERFDLIFADPPYDKNFVNRTISSIIETNALNVDGILIIEHSSKEEIDQKWARLINKQKQYGNTTVTFFTGVKDK